MTDEQEILEQLISTNPNLEEVIARLVTDNWGLEYPELTGEIAALYREVIAAEVATAYQEVMESFND